MYITVTVRCVTSDVMMLHYSNVGVIERAEG